MKTFVLAALVFSTSLFAQSELATKTQTAQTSEWQTKTQTAAEEELADSERQVRIASQYLKLEDREAFLKSNCKFIDNSMQTGFDPSDMGSNRNDCIYIHAYMIISSEVNTKGPILSSRKGTVYYRPNSNSKYTSCPFEIKAGKRVSRELEQFIKSGPPNVDGNPYQNEFFSLVDFNCLTS